MCVKRLNKRYQSLARIGVMIPERILENQIQVSQTGKNLNGVLGYQIQSLLTLYFAK